MPDQPQKPGGVRRGDDPRRLGGGIAGPGGPHDRHAFVVDTRNAVLMDRVEVAIVEPQSGGKPQPSAFALRLEGRINKTQDRAGVLYLFDEDGAASIISELIAVAGRLGPELQARLIERLRKLADEGNLRKRGTA